MAPDTGRSMNRTRWFDIGGVALAVAILIGLTVSSFSGGHIGFAATPSATATRPQGDTATEQLALFIGDSYTAGASSAELSYGCRAAVEMHWLCALSARAGTGYI